MLDVSIARQMQVLCSPWAVARACNLAGLVPVYYAHNFYALFIGPPRRGMSCSLMPLMVSSAVDSCCWLLRCTDRYARCELLAIDGALPPLDTSASSTARKRTVERMGDACTLHINWLL